MFQIVVETTRLPDLTDTHPDAPLKLAEAVWLPELGGRLSPKQLWNAIGTGGLSAERHGRIYFVTRRGIREWRESCRVKQSPLVFGSNPSAAGRTEASDRRADGSFEMERRSTALAAARKIAAARKQRSSAT